MPELWGNARAFPVTAEEHRQLLAVRLETLSQVHRESMLSASHNASDRIGWTAHIQTLRRDRRGCLLARIIVRAPHLHNPYIRNVRLIRSHPLPRDLA
jgi:hypothetical protein